MLRRGMEVTTRGRNPAREGHSTRQTQSLGGGRQAWPKAIVANSPAETTAQTRERQGLLQRRLTEKEEEVDAYRQQVEHYKRDLKLLTDQLAKVRLAAEEQANILEEKERALTLAQTLNGGMKRAVAGLRKEIADSTAWAHEPARGAEALAHLLSGGDATGPPTYVDTQVQWSPGILREIHMWKKAGACACMREFAANSLSHPQQRFEDITILGQGGFGIIRRGTCKKTNKVYAVKIVKPGFSGLALVREMLAFSILDTHKNIVSIHALSDVAGSEGIIMEVAACDLFVASTGKSDLEFTLGQILSFEADATEGLSYMHGKGIIHCDVKMENTLVCRGDGPGGFVGKLTDPGVWCGLGELRAVKTGTLGRVPVENILGEVLAAPNQDAFAAGSDSCFLVMQPDMKTGGANLWAHWSLTTEEERQLIITRNEEGGDVNPIRADVTLRTMSDGTMARVLLQPEMLNPDLPASELVNVCQILRRMVSRDPTERLSMPAFTAFLRRLAAKTAATLVVPLPEMAVPPLIEHPSGIGSGIGHPPVISLPPSEVAVIVGGGKSGEGLTPLADSIRGEDISTPAPVLAPHAEGGTDDAAAAVPLAEDTGADIGLAPRDSTPPAVDLPAAAEAVAVANSTVPPLEEIALGVLSVQRVPLAPPLVVAPHAERNPDSAPAGVLPAEPLEVGNDLAPSAVNPPVEAEAANPVIPSPEEVATGVDAMEQTHFAPPPAVAPHTEGADDGVATAVPSAGAAEAGSGSAMRGPVPSAVNSPAEAEPADVADIALEEIARHVNPLLRPFPRSPAEVMANYVAGTLRTQRSLLGMENVPLPVAARQIAGRACRGGGGGGGGEGFVGKRTQGEGRWGRWLAGLTRR